MFTHDKINNIEVDIIDACGLKCPMCSRNSKETLNNLKNDKKYLSLDKNIEIFNRFKNLRHVSFVGTRSESTLYPEMIAFVEYLKSRGVTITISTNGNSRDTKWWEEIGTKLKCDDEVRFAIDGSTQDTYSHYRVGGRLKTVLKHHEAIKNKSDCITTLQFIKFKYNTSDIDNIKEMFVEQKFNKLLFAHGSYTLDGRLEAEEEKFVNSDFIKEDYNPPDAICKKYKLIESSFRGLKKAKIECTSYMNNEIFINHMGNYTICCFHNGELLRTGCKGGDMKFVNDEHVNKVIKNKYSFCLLNCNKLCKQIIGADLSYD